MTVVLNPFPGYPVATIAGQLDWTADTEEIRDARESVGDFVTRWRSGSVVARAHAPSAGRDGSSEPALAPVSDRAAVIQISGDYGSGKTHVLLEIDRILRARFNKRGVEKINILRVAGIEADPASWYKTSIGRVLGDLGGRGPDGGWFAQLALDVYTEAARAFLPAPEKLTDPASAFQLVRNDILNATAVEHGYVELINTTCEKFSESVRSQLIALLDQSRRAEAEQWLSGGPAPAGAANSAAAVEFRDGEAIDVLAAAAALSLRVGVPFAILIDEIELFLRADDRSGTLTNEPWLKRLLSELANAGALVAVSGHRSAWDRRADFLQRFSAGKRIEMRRLLAEDVLNIVSRRAGTNLHSTFKKDQAEAVAEATHGNMRRVLALCRALFDQSDGFTKGLDPGEIAKKAAELAQAPKPDQVLLRVQELFEERKLSISKDLLRSRSLKFEFDLVARGRAESYFVVMVRPTPNVKEAQDFVQQYLAQLSAAMRRGERFTAFFLCDTPADRAYVDKANEPRGIVFEWIDYTDARFIMEVTAGIDRQFASEQIPGESTRSAVVAELETVWSRRLDELDRRRTAELRELEGRLAATMKVAEAASEAATSAALRAEVSIPETQPATVPPPPVAVPTLSGLQAFSETNVPIQPFSAAALFERPTLSFRLRILLGPDLVIFMTSFLFGFVMIVFGNDFADLPFAPQIFNSSHAASVSFNLFGYLLIFVTLAHLIGRFFGIENYFDHASRLIKEFYLAAPNPRLVAGADRLSRELILRHGPRKALDMFNDELANLVKGSQQWPSTNVASSEHPTQSSSDPSPAGTGTTASPSPVPVATHPK